MFSDQYIQEEHRAFEKRLKYIKAKWELYGERTLTAEERVIMDERRAYFFPGETRK